MKKTIFLCVTLITIVFSKNIFAETLLRGPYIQSLTNTSVKIMWRTDVEGDSKVLYGDSPGNLNQSVYIQDTVEDHIVQISGLQPATTYYYCVITNNIDLAGNDSRHRFLTAPVADDTSLMRIWVTGDFGAGSSEQRIVRQRFANYDKTNPTNFWLWLGDNVYDDGRDFEYSEKVFDKQYGYDSIFRFLPFYPCPGNHDYNSVYNRNQDPAIHRGAYFDLVETFRNGEGGGVPSGAEAYYSYDYGNAHFISLNSELIQYVGDKNSVMAKWLKADLAASTKMWKIAYWHQPPYSKGSHDSDVSWELIMKGMRENYVPILESYGVDLVLNGHSHVYERSYLLKGHYGKSNTLKPYMIKDSTDGNPDHGNYYIKYNYGPLKDTGTVYAVVGNSGKSESANGVIHPAMIFKYEGSGASGSMILEIEGNTMRSKYMDINGDWIDKFTIQKINNPSTAIKNNILKDIKLFPNIVSDAMTVSYTLENESRVLFSIIDINGSIISTIDGGNVAANAKQNFIISKTDLENLPSQLYYLKIDTDSGTTSLPFVKQ